MHDQLRRDRIVGGMRSRGLANQQNRIVPVCSHNSSKIRYLGTGIAPPLRQMHRAATAAAAGAARAASSAASASLSSAGAAAVAPKAALLIIGNEVLSGRVQDANTPWLAKLLYRCVCASTAVCWSVPHAGRGCWHALTPKQRDLTPSAKASTCYVYTPVKLGAYLPEPHPRSRGVDLVRCEYIPDDVDDIAETLRRLRKRVGLGGDDEGGPGSSAGGGGGGYVFTSGGIGPTHDDVTYEAVAAAFGARVCPPS